MNAVRSFATAAASHKGPKNQGLPLVGLFSKSVLLISISMTLMISFSLLKISSTPVIRRLLVLIQHLISQYLSIMRSEVKLHEEILGSLMKRGPSLSVNLIIFCTDIL